MELLCYNKILACGLKISERLNLYITLFRVKWNITSCGFTHGVTTLRIGGLMMHEDHFMSHLQFHTMLVANPYAHLKTFDCFVL